MKVFLQKQEEEKQCEVSIPSSTISGARCLPRWPGWPFEGGNYAKMIRELPYKIIPGEVAKYRQNILVERAGRQRAYPPGHRPALRNVSE